ncbi:hypothetical protein HPB50_026351 [Hyalomma asiaticum]|uniref:Uncharacterized protein n=1 Tax=Hyalomma asiaticum TaxID=266040 RepID=A0ACB7T261_HYAAI|nr:hypothetical protein HPB50_026351 [Hyalomma asiaticum]
MKNLKAKLLKMDWRKKSNAPPKPSRTSLAAQPAVPGSDPVSPSLEMLSSPMFNTAMEALRKLKHEAKGATPFTEPDSFRPCGHHARAMLTACSGSVAAGVALGFASAAMPSIEHRFWRDALPGPPENRWIADSLFLGASVGSLLSGGLTMFWVGLMFANKISMIIVNRVALGIFVGVITNCVCLYVTDVAPPAKRTLYGGLIEVATGAGVLCAYALANLAWQQQAAGCAMASVPVLVLHHYVVENPRWLVSKGLSLHADTAVMRLYGLDPPDDFRDRKGVGVEEQNAAVAPSRLWPRHARMVSTCLLLHLLQNISGAQMCLLRAVQVMSNMVTEVSPRLLAVVLVSMQFACTILATFLTQVVSRRTQLGASAFLVSCTLFIFRPLEHLAFTHWSVRDQPSRTSWGAVFSVTMLLLAYSVGLCHLPTLLTGELVPSRIRLLGSSIVWSSRWFVMFLLLHYDVDVLNAFRERGPLLALSLTLTVVATTAILLIPETEGKSLAQIEHG